MATTDSQSAPDGASDQINEADLERAMKGVPKGTLALTGLAVALTLVGWLIVYFGIFIPRGVVN